MLLRQLFDADTCSYTYLLGDESTGIAAVIDPVRGHTDDVLALLAELHLALAWSLETHTHADHVTAGGDLRRRTRARMAVHAAAAASSCADLTVRHGDRVPVGALELEVIETPGHTIDSVSYYLADRLVFTGDALLVGTCGRTDFQGGDPGALFDSIHQRLFVLPEHVEVYPAHDYQGCARSTIGDEKRDNQRVAGRTRQSFIELMNGLNLAPPRHIAEAVPANDHCGLEPIRDV